MDVHQLNQTWCRILGHRKYSAINGLLMAPSKKVLSVYSSINWYCFVQLLCNIQQHLHWQFSFIIRNRMHLWPRQILRLVCASILYQEMREYFIVFNHSILFNVKELTLIRAAGGVYEFWNFEEVYLCNGLRSELRNSCIPQKTSHEYILLSTLERKTAFLAIYRPKRAQNCPFFRRFWLFCTAVKV